MIWTWQNPSQLPLQLLLSTTTITCHPAPTTWIHPVPQLKLTMQLICCHLRTKFRCYKPCLPTPWNRSRTVSICTPKASGAMEIEATHPQNTNQTYHQQPLDLPAIIADLKHDIATISLETQAMFQKQMILSMNNHPNSSSVTWHVGLPSSIRLKVITLKIRVFLFFDMEQYFPA